MGPVSVFVNDNAMGSVTVSPEKPMPGESVTLTATANEGYKLVGFESDDVEKLWILGNECMFTMPYKDITVTANFTAVSDEEHDVTVSTNFSGMGSVSVDKSTAKFGDLVTLTPSANAGNSFVEFKSLNVQITKDGNSYKFYMPDESVYIQAIFKADASFTANETYPIQAQKDNGTAVLRFMWDLSKTDGAYLANVGAYIIPWNLFNETNKELGAKPAIVLVSEPTMKTGDTFSADYIGIPDENDNYDTEYCAIPFINGTFFANALIRGTVNSANIDNN